MKRLFIYLLLTFAALSNSNAQDHNATDKFVGVWYYYTSSYNLEPNHNSNDHSLEGQIVKIKKLEDTDKSYSVNLSSYPSMIFTQTNATTLKGINISATVTYIASSHHIRVYMGKAWMEFKKLQ